MYLEALLVPSTERHLVYDDQRPTTNDQRSSGWLIASLIAGVAACTTPNPLHRRDAAVDASATIDPKAIVRVSPSGRDSADGVAAPVKTIKRAIEIATADGSIKVISLDAGKYNSANGEKYPYTLPTGVTMVGAAGATLAGTATEDGLVVDNGTIENIEFSDFKTALHATSIVTLTSVTVKSSSVGVLADGSATVLATALAIVGDTECKTIGVQALGMAQVTVSSFVTTDALALDGRDHATVSIANGVMRSAAANCFPQLKMNGKSLTLSDTTITGGRGGIWLNYNRGVPFTENELLDVNLTNVTIADTGGEPIHSDAHEFKMTGGEIRNNYSHGAQLHGGGVHTFTNVAFKGNHSGIASENINSRVKVRGCTMTGNEYGLVWYQGTSADLGTTADPGGNTIRNNRRYGLILHSPSVVTATAVGNTWNPSTDGSDANGKYATQVIVGSHDGGNFYIFNPASSIQL